MKRPDWFPDWSGQIVVIVASGPSASTVDLEPAKQVAKVVAINSSFRLCPWADLLYGCDAKWWISESGVPAFKGLKVAGEKRASEMYEDVCFARVLPHDDRLTLEPGTLGSGGNSGFQALNLSIQFGARRFVLVGYDMSIDAGLHWHGKHSNNLNNPSLKNLPRWRRSLDNLAPQLRDLGVIIFNASPVSALTAYPKLPFQEALLRCASMSD